MESNKKITKYPYNGKATNLIDKFIIIGYEINNIKKIIPQILKQENAIKSTYYYNCTNQAHNSFTEILLTEPIDILSEIVFDPEKSCLPHDYIINSIFPEPPRAFREMPCDPKALQMNIVFSGNALKDETKNSFNCYGYLFYEKIKYNSTNYCYLPKAFVIISEYPYFTSFSQLSNQIEQLYSNMRDIPIEYTLYNLVKYTPSPIQFSFNLNLLPQNNSSQIPFFAKISGYPLFQFNLSVLFSILPSSIIIKIFLFSFLETEMLIFSDNLEILNMILYIFLQLNYPLNVMHYYWQSGASSLQSHIDGSLLGSRIYTSLQGINTTYKEDLFENQEPYEHFIIDLEKKIFIYEYASGNSLKYVNTIMNNNKLLDYINSVLNSHEAIDPNESTLTQEIKLLYNNIDQISKKIVNSYNSTRTGFPNFFADSDLNQTINKSIQQYFYDFICKTITELKRFNHFKVNLLSDDANSQNESALISVSVLEEKTTEHYKILYDNSYSNISEGEVLFFKGLEDCSKNVLFVNITHKSQMFIDIFQISNIFFDELTNWCVINKDKRNYIKDPFDAIDELYKSNHDNTVIDFSQFNNYYLKNWKNQLAPELKLTSIYKPGPIKSLCFSYIGKSIEFNYDILNLYLNILNNSSSEILSTVFPFKKIIEEFNYGLIDQITIQNSIEMNIIKHNDLPIADLIYLCLLSAYSVSLTLGTPFKEEHLYLILSSFINSKINKQKYITYILNVINKRLINTLNHQFDVFEPEWKFLDKLISLILTKDIVPNEELSKLLNSCYDRKQNLQNYKQNNNQFSRELSSKKIIINTKKESLDELIFKIDNDLKVDKNEIESEKLDSITTNMIFDGDFLIKQKEKNKSCLRNTIIKVTFLDDNNDTVIIGNFISIRKMYHCLTEMMSFEENDPKQYQELIINLLYYLNKIPNILSNELEKNMILNYLCQLILFFHCENNKQYKRNEPQIVFIKCLYSFVEPIIHNFSTNSNSD